MSVISIDRLANGNVKIVTDGDPKYIPGAGIDINVSGAGRVVLNRGEKQLMSIKTTDTLTIDGDPAPGTAALIAEALAEVFFLVSGDSVSPESLDIAVDNYLTENPPSVANGSISESKLSTAVNGHIADSVIDVAKAYGVLADGSTDNATVLMQMRSDLAGPNKPHYNLYFPYGEIRYSNNRWLYGIEKFTIHGGGARFRTIYSGGDWAFQRAFYSGHMFEDNVLSYSGTITFTTSHLISTVVSGSTVVSSTTAADSADAVAGARVLIWGYVMGVGYPPLVLRHDYNEILSVDAGANTITLKYPLRHSYSSEWYDQFGESLGTQSVGKARITFLDRAAGKYPRHAEFRDLTFGSNTSDGADHAAIYPSEYLKISNCKVEGFLWPSECKTVVYEDIEVPNKLTEFDRFVTNLYCKRVKFNKYLGGAPGIINVFMEECQTSESIEIAPRNYTITNHDMRANNHLTAYSPALGTQPGRYPIQRITIDRLKVSATANYLETSLIDIAPFSTYTIAVVSGNNIIIPDTDNDAAFNVPRTVDPGVTRIWKNDGSKGGTITSITYDATYNSGQGAYVVAGDWTSAPVVAEVWVWCNVKEVIDLGGHRNHASIRMWSVNSMRWIGNKSTSAVKECKISTNDLARNATMTVPFYGHIIDIEVNVSKIASVSNKISIMRNGTFADIATINMQERGWRKLTQDVATSAKTGDTFSTTEINTWLDSILIQCHNGSYASASDITDAAWPNFEIIIRWTPF